MRLAKEEIRGEVGGRNGGGEDITGVGLWLNGAPLSKSSMVDLTRDFEAWPEFAVSTINSSQTKPPKKSAD
jgi:hypothetical protein